MTSIKSEKKKILEPIEVFTLLYIEDLAKDVYKNQNHIISLYNKLEESDRYWTREVLKKFSNYLPLKKRRGLIPKIKLKKILEFKKFSKSKSKKSKKS